MEFHERIREKSPLIHYIANIVTVNDCANILLALGARPTMAHHPLEVEEIAAAADALVLNLGATECLEAMERAGRAARRAGVPIVLDPVGASGAAFRREQALHLIEAVKPTLIRGNASELLALAQNRQTRMGVDACENPVQSADEGQELLRQLEAYARRTGSIVVASGATDYITDGQRTESITGGSALMKYVTGTGCMSSGLLAAFLAAEPSIAAVSEGIRFLDRCAEKAEARTRELQGGTMTFRQQLIDEIAVQCVMAP